MARNYAQIQLGIWGDPDWRTLSHGAQWLYLLLISQPALTEAGVLDLRPRRWSALTTGTTPADVEGRLDELAAARFVVIDPDTEELLIRTYVRNSGLWRMPNLVVAALDAARQVLSLRLRAVLAEELERIPWDSLSGARAETTRGRVAETVATLRKGTGTHAKTHVGTHAGTHTGRDAETHPGTQAEPMPKPMPEPIPEPIPDGQARPAITGTGTGTPHVVSGFSSLSERDETRFSETITGHSDARPDEIPTVLAHIRDRHRPDSLGAWLRTVAARGDLQDIVDAARAAAAPPPRRRERCPEHLLELPCRACAADAKAAPSGHAENAGASK